MTRKPRAFRLDDPNIATVQEGEFVPPPASS